ncbi:MAG: hypothetical protein IJE19_09795 [Clostridia bacterium]|nr:hypothetical protein [Clostridia bacterium]
MDRRDLEKLMDKYKQEMLEFQRKNNISGYPGSSVNPDDERETRMDEALRNNTPFERDRSNPLPEAEREEPDVPSEAQQEPQTVAVQAPAARRDDTLPLDGESPDVERLLRRSCENLPENASNEQRARCRSINDFLAANTESGTLKVEAFASDRAFGVPSARVMVFLELPGGNVAVFDGLTDVNGTTESVRLPAPPKSLSQSPQTDPNPRLPYAVYSVYVEHPDYVRAVFTNVPVFSGIESIQPVRMLAKSAGLEEPEPIVVDETTLNTLRNEAR